MKKITLYHENNDIIQTFSNDALFLKGRLKSKKNSAADEGTLCKNFLSRILWSVLSGRSLEWPRVVSLSSHWSF